jgi:N,N'-diacetyllegionaminate synthase
VGVCAVTLSSGKVLIIAEIGSNHDGDLDKALRLIDVAADCGADVAKFQSFLADEMLAPDHPNYPMLKRLEMPREWYPRLMERCENKGLRFLSTATNFTTLGWMEALGAWSYKVASCNITYAPLLDRLMAIGKPVIVSTGMATLEEVIALARRFVACGLESAFLHCVSKYPCPSEQMRLRNIAVLRDILPCPVGLSDHSHGSHLAVAAVALGARVVEKHLTNDANGYSPDHKVSVLPDTFAEMVRAIRETEQALVVDFAPDLEAITTMRRSLHFAASLPPGHVLTEADIKVTRPEDGLPPAVLPSIIGRRLIQAVTADQPIGWALLEGTS